MEIMFLFNIVFSLSFLCVNVKTQQKVILYTLHILLSCVRISIVWIGLLDLFHVTRIWSECFIFIDDDLVFE